VLGWRHARRNFGITPTRKAGLKHFTFIFVKLLDMERFFGTA
jgi:hypothetical protein